MVKILYFYITGDWKEVIPEAGRKFFNFLMSDVSESYFKDNQICINCRYEDLTDKIWITVTETFIIENYPELIGFDINRSKYSEFLDWKPENFGIHSLEPKNPEIEDADRYL